MRSGLSRRQQWPGVWPGVQITSSVRPSPSGISSSSPSRWSGSAGAYSLPKYLVGDGSRRSAGTSGTPCRRMYSVFSPSMWAIIVTRAASSGWPQADPPGADGAVLDHRGDAGDLGLAEPVDGGCGAIHGEPDRVLDRVGGGAGERDRLLDHRSLLPQAARATADVSL